MRPAKTQTYHPRAGVPLWGGEHSPTNPQRATTEAKPSPHGPAPLRGKWRRGAPWSRLTSIAPPLRDRSKIVPHPSPTASRDEETAALGDRDANTRGEREQEPVRTMLRQPDLAPKTDGAGARQDPYAPTDPSAPAAQRPTPPWQPQRARSRRQGFPPIREGSAR